MKYFKTGFVEKQWKFTKEPKISLATEKYFTNILTMIIN